MGEPNTLERINQLESALAHQQREYDLLNQVVIEQGELIDQLRRKLTSLESSLKSVEDRLPNETNLVDERPPHY